MKAADESVSYQIQYLVPGAVATGRRPYWRLVLEIPDRHRAEDELHRHRSGGGEFRLVQVRRRWPPA